MASSSEKFCLKWNDFQQNIASSYHNLRKDQDFSYVTLICEDHHQIEAHKIILNACSPFFSDVLKRNKHPHPMIYMRAVKSKDMLAILDFIYHGEANIYQEDLNGFLELSEELQLKGLSGTKDNIEDVAEVYLDKTQQQEPRKNGRFFKQENILQPPSKLDNETYAADRAEYHSIVPVDVPVLSSFADNSMEDMKSKLDSMIERVDGRDDILKCTVCGKGTMGKNAKTILRQHIETHIEGLSYPCNQCDTVSKTSNNLKVHVFRTHRSRLYKKYMQ